jgi:hypothetical protein
MSNLFRGFEQLLESAKALEEKSAQEEPKPAIQFSSPE